MLRFKVELFLSDFVSHSGQTADPTNVYSKAMKAISSKRKKTDADFEQLAAIEFKAGLYLDPQGRVVIPGRVIEAAICEGARRAKEGRLALAGLFIDSDAVVDKFDGGPLSVDELVKSEQHRLCVAVRVGTSRVMRTRPHFKNVETSFEISLNPEVANPAQLKGWLDATVEYVGLGDWRPRHGRGTILKIEEIKAPLRVAAE